MSDWVTSLIRWHGRQQGWSRLSCKPLKSAYLYLLKHTALILLFLESEQHSWQ